MSKKILHILALFSFLNFGLSTQTSFDITSQDKSSQDESLQDESSDIDFSDIDLDNLGNIDEIEVASPGLKKKLAILAEVLKGMPLKEKIAFLSAILKNQIKEHKKKCIIATIVLAGITLVIVVPKCKKD